jgi:hypothetical protein
MQAAEVCANLSAIADKPENEAQTRQLAPLEADEQRIVWELAKATAPDGEVTAAHIRSLADGIQPSPSTDRGC